LWKGLGGASGIAVTEFGFLDLAAAYGKRVRESIQGLSRLCRKDSGGASGSEESESRRGLDLAVCRASRRIFRVNIAGIGGANEMRSQEHVVAFDLAAAHM